MLPGFACDGAACQPARAVAPAIMVNFRRVMRDSQQSISMQVQVAGATRPPRRPLVVGNIKPDNDGVGFDNVCRPTLERAGFIVPCQHKAAIHFATGHKSHVSRIGVNFRMTGSLLDWPMMLSTGRLLVLLKNYFADDRTRRP